MNQGSATVTSTGAPEGTPGGRRPLRRDAERNRLLILSAARTVFAQRGLDASLDEIAREAGLGVGTVYRRFPNRDALVDALFADAITTIGRIVDEAVAMPLAWDGLRHFMASMLQLQCQDKGLRDVMLDQHPGEATDELVRDRIKPPLRALVQRAKDEGGLRPDLTDNDVGVLEVAALGAAEFTGQADPDVWRRYLAVMMDGMRARPGNGEDGAEGGNTRLEQPSLDDDQLDACMHGWKYGTRETPRQRQRPGS
jgi:AcrR family transcriptional regulator